MPFQPINFAGIAPIGSPALRNLSENLQKGMQTAQMPGALQRQKQQQELANALQQLKLDAAPQEMQEQSALRQAQIAQQQAGTDKINMLKDILSGGKMGTDNQLDSEPGDLRKSLVRKMLGLPDETPAEKQQREISTFQQKQQYETEHAGDLTGSTRSDYQKRMSFVPGLISGAEHLASLPSPVDIPLYRMPSKDIHRKAVSSLADTYLNARGLPATEANVNLAKDIFERAKFESDKDYRKRINNEIGLALLGMKDIYDQMGKEMPKEAKKYLKSLDNETGNQDRLGLK